MAKLKIKQKTLILLFLVVSALFLSWLNHEFWINEIRRDRLEAKINETMRMAEYSVGDSVTVCAPTGMRIHIVSESTGYKGH
jgi:hypothetical protein